LRIVRYYNNILIIRLCQFVNSLAYSIAADVAFTLFFALESISRLLYRRPFAHLMSTFRRHLMAMYTFLPVLVVRILVFILVSCRGNLAILPRVTAFTGMRCISAFLAGRLRYRIGILMCMTACQLRNRLLLYVIAVVAIVRTLAFFLLRSFLCDLARAENMYVSVKFCITAVTAYYPVLRLVIFYLRRIFNAMVSHIAIMASPFIAVYANSMVASKRLCRVLTALLTKLAITARVNAVFADSAFLANLCANRAILVT